MEASDFCKGRRVHQWNVRDIFRAADVPLSRAAWTVPFVPRKSVASPALPRVHSQMFERREFFRQRRNKLAGSRSPRRRLKDAQRYRNDQSRGRRDASLLNLQKSGHQPDFSVPSLSYGIAIRLNRKAFLLRGRNFGR